MRKGFIFSLDAAIALAIVIIAIGVLAQQQGAAGGSANVSENLHKKALDRALTGFYEGRTSAETLEGSAPDFGECNFIYTLDPNNGETMASPAKQSFCETI